MKMPEPVAYCSVRPLQGDESAPKFEVSWVGRKPIAGPLYDKQALIDLLEAALSEEIAEHAGRQWWAKTRHTNGPLHLERYASDAIMKEVHETARIVIEAAVNKLKETL